MQNVLFTKKQLTSVKLLIKALLQWCGQVKIKMRSII